MRSDRPFPANEYPKLRIMIIGEDFDGRQSTFERMLNELDEADSSGARRSGRGAESLWAGACAPPRGHSFFQTGAVESLYAEALSMEGQTAPDAASMIEKATPPALTPTISEIRRELAAARNLDDLRRLRRRCALAAHPDRVGPLERPTAEKLMAEVNAAIDGAIKDKAQALRKY